MPNLGDLCGPKPVTQRDTPIQMLAIIVEYMLDLRVLTAYLYDYSLSTVTLRVPSHYYFK